MSFNVIIPARFASTRLPGKPLRDIAGKSMIQRVYEQAKKSEAQAVVVATDNKEIFEHVKSFGGEVFMTSSDHPSGTDRLQETAALLGLADGEIIVNVQGDEPLIPPEVINQVAKNLEDRPSAGAATLSEPILEKDLFFDPNVVKVVSDINGQALYFSRAPIPWDRDGSIQNKSEGLGVTYAQRHIGIYAYQVGLLNRFVGWPAAALESIEKLEQLRILANGRNIHVEPACAKVPGGVDTQEDLDRVIASMSN